MKSIYLLCEYGIPLHKVLYLDYKGVNIDDLTSDENNIYNYLDHWFIQKYKINEILTDIIQKEKEQSVFEFVRYGLAIDIIQKLYINKINIEDINNKIRKKYNFNEKEYYNIENALNKFYNNKDLKLNQDNPVFIEVINEELKCEFLKISERINGFHDKILYYCDNGTLEGFNEQYKESHSVLELKTFGLSDNIIVNSLVNNGIKFDEIDKTILNKYNITPSKQQKILESYEYMTQYYNIKKKLKKDKVIAIIKENEGIEGLTVEKIENILFDSKYELYELDGILEHLISENKITKENEKYKITVPKLRDRLELLREDEKKYDIVIRKLNGETLDKIGSTYNISKERVRQIFSKELNKLGKIEEDKLLDYMQKYDFKEDLFCKLFEQDKLIYNYLKEKGQKGEISPAELIEDSSLSSKQIEILRKEYNVINYNDELIVADTMSIIMAYLKKVDKRVEYSELMNNYNQIIKDYNLNLTYLTEDDLRNLDSRLSRTNLVLDTMGKSYRYYNCNYIENEDIDELKNMLNTDSGVYSSEFFFKNNILLMKKLDIRDNYELHNLCKKVLGKFDEGIIYSRMPDIFIHCQNKMDFIEEKIRELSPIKLDDFAGYMYRNYGHKENSMKAYLTSNFYRFINSDMLICDVQEFTEEQFNIMKVKLQDDIYSINTIKKMLTDCFDVDDFKLLNSLNLNKLGYRLRDNYIIKSNINSLEHYLKNIIISNDYYEISQEMKKIGSTFTSYLYKFIYDKMLFKISDDKYITMKKMNKLGITIEDVNDFIKRIEKSIPENKYFNLYTLNTDFSNKVLDFDFPDCFYEYLIMIIPEVKSFRMKNNVIFIKTNESATREKFINSFINNKTYIKDISNEIYQKYQIKVENYYVKQFINRNKYYLDNSTDCVYESREKYEEDVNQWDILKYID